MMNEIVTVNGKYHFPGNQVKVLNSSAAVSRERIFVSPLKEALTDFGKGNIRVDLRVRRPVYRQKPIVAARTADYLFLYAKISTHAKNT